MIHFSHVHYHAHRFTHYFFILILTSAGHVYTMEEVTVLNPEKKVSSPPHVTYASVRAEIVLTRAAMKQRRCDISDFGVMYYHGNNVEKNIATAVKCFEWQIKQKKSTRAKAQAWYYLAGIHFLGCDGWPKNRELGLQFYALAANQTACKHVQAEAEAELGRICYYGVDQAVDFKLTHDHFQQAALHKEESDAYSFACLHLGKMFLWGQYVTQDYEKARSYCKKAAKKARTVEIKVAAEFLLGEIYLLGLGVTIKTKRALEHFLFVAKHQKECPGDWADACWRLGAMLSLGLKDVPMDFQAGLDYLQLAIDQTVNPRAQRAAHGCMGDAFYYSDKNKQPDLECAGEHYSWVVSQKGNYDFDQWALVKLGKVFYKTGHFKLAKKHLLMAAQQKIFLAAAEEAKSLMEKYSL